MSRYVDAEYIKVVMLNDRLMQGNAEFTLYAQQVETQVNALPSIDIVRCSECKHWRTYETWSECERWTDDPYESAKTKADDFCSYGERSEKPNNLSEIPTGSADTQTYFTEDRDTRILDAWQVKQMQTERSE